MSTSAVVASNREPAVPVIESQDAAAQGSRDIRETALWCYQLRYLHEHARQDQVHVVVSCNIPLSADSIPMSVHLPAERQFRICVQLLYSDDGECVQALQLTCEGESAGLTETWPTADYRSAGGHAVDLALDRTEGGVRRYLFVPPLVAEPWPRIGLTWNTLGVTDLQNARASLAVVRQRVPAADGASSDGDFRTATVDAASAVSPSNHWPQDIDISDLGDTAEVALDTLFTTLFGDNRVGQSVSIGVQWGYSVRPAESESPRVYLPVALFAPEPIDASTSKRIATALATWSAATNPPLAAGIWLFSLTAFSQIDAQMTRPLLQLGRLIYRLR